MDDNQIWLERDRRTELLSDRPDYRLDDLARWTGLRMGAFGFPDHGGKSSFYSKHPHVSLFTQGRATSELQVGLRSRNVTYQRADLLCYAGDVEVRRTHWHAENAHALVIELDRERLASFAGADLPLSDRVLTGKYIFNDEALAALMLAMWREVQTGSRNGRLFAESLSLGVAAHMFGRFGRVAATASGRLSSAQVRNVEQYLRARLGESIGLAELAQTVGLSVSHFSRMYRNATGMTPYQRLLTLRVEHASVLLRESDLPLAEVALSCGFSSQSHLSDTCQRLLGRTPRHLRASN